MELTLTFNLMTGGNQGRRKKYEDKMRGTWRSIAKPIIQQVLKENTGKSEKEIRKALKEAYPFGERHYHPYKVWLDEIKVQLGKKKFGRRDVVIENQEKLF